MKRKSLHIDTALVQRLISKQFPQWANFPIQPVKVGGWDNRTFHLGSQMLVRMPSAEEYADKIEKEQKWLPLLAPLLPLSIPKPIAMGEPGEGYPWRWSVYQWIKGETAAAGYIDNMQEFAKDLVNFIMALQHIDITDGPLPSPRSFAHQYGLTTYNHETKQALTTLNAQVDVTAAMAIWEAGLQTQWQHAPVWVHGDISAANLLVENGKLKAVIDFGGLAIGDPACDLVIAWKFFDNETRKTFRRCLPLDKDTWARGRAWALWKALIIKAGIVQSNTLEIEQAAHTIQEAITDFQNN